MVLDTHQWIWLVTGRRTLSSRVRDRIAATPHDIYLSSASIWEAMVLLQEGRIKPAASPERTIRSWIDTYPLKIDPIDQEVVLVSRTFPFTHKDPMDRFIAATAFRRNVPLATSDARLIALPWLTTVS